MTKINLNTSVSNAIQNESVDNTKNQAVVNTAENTEKSDFTKTNENTLAEYKLNNEGAGSGNYDERIDQAEKEIKLIQEALEEYQKLIDKQEEQIEQIEKNIEDQENKRDKIQSEINSLNGNDKENANKKLQLQQQITSLNTFIVNLNSQLTNAISKKSQTELTMAMEEIHLSRAQSQYNEACKEKQEAQIAQEKASMLDSIKNSVSNGVNSVKNGINTIANAFTGGNSANTGRISQNGLNIVKEFEGCKLTAYKCPAGVPTIGYGHTNGVYMGQEISQEDAEKYLREDMQEFENYVTKYAQEAGCKLTQNQFDALVSFSYNLGPGVLKSSGVLKQLASGDIEGAKNTILKYDHAKVNGQMTKLAGLTRRRQMEASLL